MTYPRGTDDTKRALTTLIDVFRSLEGRRGEFVIHDDGYRVRRFSYAQVTAAARGFAARLAAAGVQRGDTVLLWGENCAEWLACYWGAVIAGVVVVPIDYRSSAAFARKVAGIVKARVALAGAEVEHEAAHPPAAGTPAMDFSPGVPLWSFADFDWKADGPLPALAITRDDVAQIVFTSGATAEPKGVVVRHKNLLANLVPVATEVAKYKPYARPFLPLRFLNLLPLSHLFGQSMATNIPPLVDGTVVFMRSFNPHDIVTRVREWRVSVIVCVPKILDVLREHVVRMDAEGGGSAEGAVDSGALVALPIDSPRVRREVLGLRRRRRAARPRARGLLEAPGLRRHPGLWPHRNRADRHVEPPVQDQHRFGGHPGRRRRSEDCGGRRDPRARRERDRGVLRTGRRQPAAGRRRPGDGAPTPDADADSGGRVCATPRAGCTRETSASSMPRDGCSFAAARRR